MAYSTPYPSTSCARARTRSIYPPLALPPELFPHPPSRQHNADPAMYKLMTDVKRHRPRTAQDGPLTIDLTPHPYILHAQHINTYSGQLNDGESPDVIKLLCFLLQTNVYDYDSTISIEPSTPQSPRSSTRSSKAKAFRRLSDKLGPEFP